MGIDAVYWAFAFFNFCAFISVFFILTRKTELETAAAIKQKRSEAAAKKGKEEEKSEVLPSAWTPGRKALFAAGCGGVLLAGAGVIYQIASRPVPLYEAGVKKLVEQEETTVKRASKAVKDTAGAKEGPLAGPAVERLRTDLDAWAARAGAAADTVAAPPDFSGSVDAQGLTCLKGFLQSQGRYARGTKAVPGGAPAAVGVWLRETGGYAADLAAHLEGEGGAGAREVLSHKLLADADYALESGASLVKEKKEKGFMAAISKFVSKAVDGVAGLFGKGEKKPSAADSNLTFLRDGLKAAKSATKKARDDLGAVFKVPTAEVLESFTFRYGPVLLVLLACLILALHAFLKARPDHPFNNIRFVYFIFILIPVQTLFAHNWLTLPYYINRAFGGTWAGDWFEFLSNINPILIFVLAPIIAALTARASVFTMILVGTFIMAVPTFLLVLPPNVWILLSYIFIMTVGEALWQPRFLQYVAELAPEGKTGIYMGIAQFPWFLTKVVTALYSGWFLSQYCPRIGPQSPGTLWLWYGIIAMVSPLALVFTSKWIQAGLKAKASKA